MSKTEVKSSQHFDIPALIRDYYTLYPDPEVTSQKVAFGTSGHRGSSSHSTFNEEHIYAITQAVCDYRKEQNITGPLFLGMDSHALSTAAFATALEVLTANEVLTFIADAKGMGGEAGKYTATPAVSHAIIAWNQEKDHANKLADGIVITPSHNPPDAGGFKYNPTHGGPADTAVTAQIEAKANRYLQNHNKGVKILDFAKAQVSSFVKVYDYTARYVEDLQKIIDIDAIAKSGLKIAVDPLGGASLPLWQAIAEHYKLPLEIVNPILDPTFSFMPPDHDGKIRMDCSSPDAMANLLRLKENYDLALACDPDADRHGIVTPKGLLNPNQYLSIAAWYLFNNRPSWPKTAGIGKTLVTTALLDRVAKDLDRPLVSVPVGFKWFVPYLTDQSCCFCCEESAGASFLCFDGSAWSTDKDGPLLGLLAAEIRAKKGPLDDLYAELTAKLGLPYYQRLDAAADDALRKQLLAISKEQVNLENLGGDAIQEILFKAPGNNASIGGLKVATENAWFALRPSGTEAICKLYTESFVSKEHLQKVQKDALDFMHKVLN